MADYIRYLLSRHFILIRAADCLLACLGERNIPTKNHNNQRIPISHPISTSHTPPTLHNNLSASQPYRQFPSILLSKARQYPRFEMDKG